MKVSIITVTLNSEKYLSDCIRSVRGQNYKNIEHIIIDGKSTDGTLRIIRRNLDSISSWISEVDKGMYDAINKGLQIATGDVVGILNSDDMFASADSVRSIVDCFQTSKADSIYGNLVFVDPKNTHKIVRFWKSNQYKRSRFRYGWMPAHPTFYIRRELLSQYGMYENHYFTSADYEFMARYLFRNKVSSQYLDTMLIKMRTGGLSNGSFKKWFRANRRDYLAMKQNKIPFSFIVSIMKPLLKLPQFKSVYANQMQLNKQKNFLSKLHFPTYLPIDNSIDLRDESFSF